MTAEIVGAASLFVAVIVAIWQTAQSRSEILKIQNEMKPNHGSSMRDSLNRIEKTLDDQGSSIRDLRRDVGGIRQDVRLLHEADQQIREDVADVRRDNEEKS